MPSMVLSLAKAKKNNIFQQALKSYTVGNATADYLENCKGSFSKEKYADFIVLDPNSFELENVSSVQTKETWIIGELKHTL